MSDRLLQPRETYPPIFILYKVKHDVAGQDLIQNQALKKREELNRFDEMEAQFGDFT